jgi:formylmethanofuran dehydrogenase subunit B
MPERAATCAGCGCGCDDIEVAVAAGALDRVDGTCPIGDNWFAERTAAAPPVARVDGREAEFSDAVEAARPGFRSCAASARATARASARPWRWPRRSAP